MEGRCVRPQPNPVLSSLGGQDGKNSPLEMRIDDDEEGSRFGMTVIKYYNYGGNKLTFSSESLCVLLHKQKQTTAKDSQWIPQRKVWAASWYTRGDSLIGQANQ